MRSRTAGAAIALAASLAAAAPAAEARTSACNTALTSRPCLRAVNAGEGTAFRFITRKGSVGGRIHVGDGGSDTKPFTTNATGVASGLNADKVDGLNADEIIARARAGLSAPVQQSLDPAAFLPAGGKAVDADLLDGLDATQFLRTTAKAADADRLDGLDSAALFRASRVASSPGRIEQDMGDPADTVLSTGGLVVSAECVDVGGSVPGVELAVDTDEDGTIAVGSTSSVSPGPVTVNAADGAVDVFATDAGSVFALNSVDVSISKAGGLTVNGILTLGFGVHGADCTVAGSLLTTP